MARIVIAGAGAIGASIAYQLALRGADDVVLADELRVAAGATGKAMGGVRQQFSTEAEVRLARESIGFFEELGRPLFEQVGYLFLATTEDGLAALEERVELQRGLGVPVAESTPGLVDGLHVDDVLGAVACWEDGVADPLGVTRELVARAEALGVDLREGVDARDVVRDVLVIAAGARSAELSPELPIRPLCRQLVEVGPVAGLPSDLPMVLESESGFHFRRAGDRLRLAMNEPTPRWTDHEEVDDVLVADWRERIAHRYPAAAGAPVARAWAGLYDMTPGRAPDHRLGRRRRLCGVRLLRPRLHAVAGGREGRGGGAARRSVVLRPRARTGWSASRTARSSPRRSSFEDLSSPRYP